MTKKPSGGTLSTRGSSDKRPKELDPTGKMKGLLGKNKVRFHSHAAKRMGERNVIDYEVRQALHNGKHDPANDRYSSEHHSWEYSFEGKTLDKRLLRIGVSFEIVEKTGDRLLVITVIDPAKKD
jgi:hypothetical protein